MMASSLRPFGPSPPRSTTCEPRVRTRTLKCAHARAHKQAIECVGRWYEVLENRCNPVENRIENCQELLKTMKTGV